jgi:uncharacterized membrane protein
MWLPLILILLFVFYSNNGSKKISIGRQNPDELLRERFVRGEIDEATYLQMKETLKK